MNLKVLGKHLVLWRLTGCCRPPVARQGKGDRRHVLCPASHRADDPRPPALDAHEVRLVIVARGRSEITRRVAARYCNGCARGDDFVIIVRYLSACIANASRATALSRRPGRRRHTGRQPRCPRRAATWPARRGGGNYLFRRPAAAASLHYSWATDGRRRYAGNDAALSRADAGHTARA